MGYNSHFRPFKKFFPVSHVLQTQYNGFFVTICWRIIIFFLFLYAIFCSIFLNVDLYRLYCERVSRAKVNYILITILVTSIIM